MPTHMEGLEFSFFFFPSFFFSLNRDTAIWKDSKRCQKAFDGLNLPFPLIYYFPSIAKLYQSLMLLHFELVISIEINLFPYN